MGGRNYKRILIAKLVHLMIVSLPAKLKMSLRTLPKIYFVTHQIVKKKKISLRSLQSSRSARVCFRSPTSIPIRCNKFTYREGRTLL